MHVLITGASSGIGEAIANEYLERGAAISIVARRKDRLDQLASGRNNVCVIAADLGNISDPSISERIVATAIASNGPIDVLINNAGVQTVETLANTTVVDGEKMIALNLIAPLRLTKAVLPAMIERKRGAIVDISSMAGVTPTPNMVYYSASKAGSGAASEAMRAELAPYGISVLTVYPGPVRTDMETAAREKLAPSAAARYVPTGEAAELARLIADGVDKKLDRIIYPRSYAVSRHLPNLSRWLLDRFTPQLR